MNTLRAMPNSSIRHQASHALRKFQEAQAPSYKYLDKETLNRHMEHIHDMLFKELATPEDRDACEQVAKAFTYAIPYLDRYARLMKRINIDEAALVRGYKSVDWATFPEPNKNQLRRGAKEYMKAVAASVDSMVAFADRQALHLNAIKDEETVEKLLDLEPTEVDVKVSTSIRTYLKPGTEAFLTATQVCEYLITTSKGACIYWPTTIGAALQELGFVKANGGYHVELVR